MKKIAENSFIQNILCSLQYTEQSSFQIFDSFQKQ